MWCLSWRRWQKEKSTIQLSLYFRGSPAANSLPVPLHIHQNKLQDHFFYVPKWLFSAGLHKLDTKGCFLIPGALQTSIPNNPTKKSKPTWSIKSVVEDHAAGAPVVQDGLRCPGVIAGVPGGERGVVLHLLAVDLNGRLLVPLGQRVVFVPALGSWGTKTKKRRPCSWGSCRPPVPRARSPLSLS